MNQNRIYISWLIISLYAAIYVGWDMLHAQVHQDAAVPHTVQVEQDPCHRSVFHGEKDTHKTHLIAYKYCASCHVVSQPTASGESLVAWSDYPAVSGKASALCAMKAQQVIPVLSSRAPPAIV